MGPKRLFTALVLYPLSLPSSSVNIFSARTDAEEEPTHTGIYLPGSKEFKHKGCCQAQVWNTNCLQFNRLSTDRKRQRAEIKFHLNTKEKENKKNSDTALPPPTPPPTPTPVTVQVVKHWNIMSRDAESPSSDIIKSCLAMVLGNLLQVILLEHGVGLHNLKRSLPATTILGTTISPWWAKISSQFYWDHISHFGHKHRFFNVTRLFLVHLKTSSIIVVEDPFF